MKLRSLLNDPRISVSLEAIFLFVTALYTFLSIKPLPVATQKQLSTFGIFYTCFRYILFVVSLYYLLFQEEEKTQLTVRKWLYC